MGTEALTTTKRPRRRPIRSSLTFGGLAAENDHLLAVAYYDNGDYETIANRHERRCFVIGRTGSGKSAAFAHLAEEHPGRVISIVPENLSLPYLTNLDVVQHLLDLNVHLESFFVALWKHVIVVEVLKHRYRITSPEAKRNFLAQIQERVARDPAKARAVQYLDEFGDKFWCEADERVRQIAESLVDKVAKSGDLGMSIAGSGANVAVASEQTYSQESRQELAARYQRVVNEAQLPRLNDMIVVLHEEVLDSPQHFTYLVIDDLDKEWVDERLANTLIRCLFQAAVDMLRVRNLKILVALRTNIFRQLDYGAQRQGGQEEKFRGMAVPMRWTRHGLRALLEQRAEAATQFYELDQPLTLAELLPNPNRTRGNPLDYILDRTLLRPRDAILFLNAAIHEATGKRTVSWEDIQRAEVEYSRERLDALRDEWKNPYPDIDKVFEQFRSKPPRLDQEQLIATLDDVVGLLADRAFQGTVWLTELSAPIWEAGSSARSWEEMYGRLASLLYEVGFIGIVRRPGEAAAYSYQASSPAPNGSMLEATQFEIHPGFRRALQVREIEVGGR